MFKVCWGSSLLGEFPHEMEILIQGYCAENNISFHVDEEENYYLFSLLNDVSIAMGMSSADNNETAVMVKRVADELKLWGMKVLFGKLDFLPADFLKMLKVQIIVCINENIIEKSERKIRFFYSWREKKKSREIIAKIISNLASEQQDITVEVAGATSFLCNLKNLRYYLTDVPVVLIEIWGCNTSGLKYLEKSVIFGLLESLNIVPFKEQKSQVKDLMRFLEMNRPLIETVNEEHVNANQEKDDKEEILLDTKEEKLPESKKIEDKKTHKKDLRKEKKRRSVRSSLNPPEDAPHFPFVAAGKPVFSENISGYSQAQHNMGKSCFSRNGAETPYIPWQNRRKLLEELSSESTYRQYKVVEDTDKAYNAIEEIKRLTSLLP